MENKGIDISNLAGITREQVKEKFANDPRLDKILTIFDKVDSLDEKWIKRGVDKPGLGKTGTLTEYDLTEMHGLKLEKRSSDGASYASLDNNHDGNITDWELEQYFEVAKNYFGEDIDIEDYRKFLGFAASEGTKAANQKLENTMKETGMSKELIERLGGTDMVKEYKLVEKNGEKYYEREVDDFKEIRDINGKLLERRFKKSDVIGFENTEEISRYDEIGEISTSYINHETGEETHFQYGKNPGDKSYKINIKDGVAVKQSHEPSADDDEWKNMQLEDIVFGAGSPDSTRVSFKYDANNQLVGIDIQDQSIEADKPRGFTTDGKAFLTHIPKKTSADNSTVEALKSMLDGGGRYGEDYDLKIVDGKLKVLPKIKNETGKETPELKGNAFDKYKDLVSKGVHQDEDFEVEYDENGNFRYNLKNNQAREFDANYKSEVYDKDGNFISSLTVKDNEIISEKMVNGEKQISKMSFNDAFLGLALEGNFSTAGEILGDADILAGGYDIYKLADKYKEKTGRELILDVYDAIQNTPEGKNLKGMRNLMAKMQPHGISEFDPNDKRAGILKNYQAGYNEFKELTNFDPYKSQIAGLLPKVERIQNGDNAFTEKVNNDSFDVKIANGKVLVSKNGGEELSIDVSSFPENYIQNTLSKLSASVLYDIARTGTALRFNDQLYGDSFGGGTNGQYHPLKREIQLDPNATTGMRAVNVLAHECGHMCDEIDDKENAIKAIKEQLKDPWATINVDKPLTVNEILEKQGTRQMVSIGDEKLKEIFKKEYEKYKQNPPHVNSNAEYALSSMTEFFAESYSLLNIGNCKSAYVIANYFPETFARAKEIMEQNRAFREQ